MAASRVLTFAQATVILRNLGWRIRTTTEYTQAVRNFQRAWNLGAALGVDGKVGPLTSAALLTSEARRVARQSTASAHFSFSEFACKCGGRYSSCQRVVLLRDLLASMEKYRALAGPTSIVSGYRCPSHNKAVGGAANSQHMYGGAADVTYRLSTTRVKGLRAFSGIGQSGTTAMARHVDRRDKAGHNLTGGTTSAPTVWNYAT